ncbi:hypothetical protein LAZ67_X003314 [Cordylochernes scorpioides]|uniref:Uncharacterized protein n=1 Tax=Cordylochernes scorpioides TaxID=51811 RepID=A0ABY6LYX9_9ARAC|nr:hypothetical protein LAZ67_X003314 [Cordylochernes scorpioides]
MKRYLRLYKLKWKLSGVIYQVEYPEPSGRTRQSRDLVHVLRTKPNPQTPEEWLDYVNTIQKRPVTRGQPTPQRGFDRWQPESTPPPSQGHYRPQYGQLATFRRPGDGRFAFRNYADNTLPKEPREPATSSGHQPRSQGCDPSSRKGPA